MILLLNKKARAEYEILDTFQAGLVLTGPEVKSVRGKSGSLTGSYVKFIGTELYLLGAQIPPYKFADNREYDPKRTRKLLLKKSELNKLMEHSQQKGKTLVPLSLEIVHRRVKLNFGVGRGKKVHERRAELKERTVRRELEREFKKVR